MIGFIFATEKEAEPFLRMTCAQPVADAPMPTFKLPRKGFVQDAMVSICGIGPDNAAAATQYLVGQCKATAMVNAGIAGASRNNFPVGTLMRVDQVAMEDRSAEPISCAPSLPGLEHAWRQVRSANLVTCKTPVFTEERRARIAEQSDLVDMEGWAVAHVCREKQVPCLLLKAVSDFCDQQELHANLEVASTILSTFLDNAIKTRPSLFRRLSSLIKAEHTLFCLPLILAGAWLGAGASLPPISTMLLILLAGTGARAAGMAINRILDRRLDALNPRTVGRELVQGTLGMRAALGVLAGGIVLYLATCAMLGRLCLLLSPLPLAPILVYPLLKRFSSLCHFGIGLCLGLAPLGAYVAVTQTIHLSTPVIMLGLFSFCWISGFDIIYALQDLAVDLRTGTHSIPAWLGPGRAWVIAGLVHALGFAALVGLARGMTLAPGPWIAVTITGGLLVLTYLPWLTPAQKFFPLSAIIGITGSLVPFLGDLP